MKRVLTLTAAAVLALGLTACGDDVKERTVVVNPNTTPAPSTTVVTPPANNNPAPTQNNTVVVPEKR